MAVVQVEPLAEADTVGFMEGTWSLAVNGEAWQKSSSMLRAGYQRRWWRRGRRSAARHLRIHPG